MREAEIFYQRVINCYLAGDIQHLLRQKEMRSGILLFPVVSGIDALGGMIHGFKKSSCERSTRVMVDLMGISPKCSRYLYKSLRCGLVHQGTAKYGAYFFSDNGKYNRDSPIYVDQEGWLWIDCICLAERFVKAVNDVWDTRRSEIIHLPSDQDDFGYEDDLVKELPLLTEYTGDVAASRSCTGARFEHGRWIRDGLTSFSGLDPEGYFNKDLIIQIPKTGSSP